MCLIDTYLFKSISLKSMCSKHFITIDTYKLTIFV